MFDSQVRQKLVQMLGSENYKDSPEECISYAYDATKDKALPQAVLFPQTVEQIARILELANNLHIPVTPRGAGSGHTGGSIPVQGGIALVMNAFNRILEVDTDNLVAVVEPGVITRDLHLAVQEHGLFYPPDPGSMAFSTIGGNIAENAGGMKAVKYGVTKDYVLGLEVVLANGEILHTGSKCIKDVVGYNLTQLFVGSEGTLGIITKAILKLLPLPLAKTTMTAVLPCMHAAGKAVSQIIRSRIIPASLEFLDKNSIWSVSRYLDLGLPEQADALLIIELDGHPQQLEQEMQQVKTICEQHGALEINIAAEADKQEELWRARRSASASLAHHQAIKKINEDIVVPRASIPDMIAAIEDIAQKTGILIVNFGHAGDGNVHVNILPRSETLDQAKHAVQAIFEKTVQLGGRISGEHGIGTSKKEYIELNISSAGLRLMRGIKQSFDPHNILNPGKIFPDG